MAKKFLVITALHGDEGFSVEVLKKLEKELPPKKFMYDWIIGNPKAYDKNVRFIEADLNRVAPGNSKSKVYEERRAAELISLSSKYSFVIDVHGTVSDSGIVTIIPYPTVQNLFLASVLNITNNVIWYSKASTNQGPIVQHANCPAIEIECGPYNSRGIKNRLSNILREFIKDSNSLSVQQILDKIKNEEFYAVYGKEEGEHDSFIKDFQIVKNDKEIYYPFLTNQYPNITCYKMKKVDIKQHLLYDA